MGEPVTFQRSSTTLTERFDDVAVVLDHASGRAVRLNQAASCVWDALAEPAAADAVAAALAERFGIDAARARDDAGAALASLAERGLIQELTDDRQERGSTAR